MSTLSTDSVLYSISFHVLVCPPRCLLIGENYTSRRPSEWGHLNAKQSIRFEMKNTEN